MVVSFRSADAKRRRLRITVMGEVVRTKQDGRGTKDSAYESHEAALEAAERAVARRLESGKWVLLGRTDESRYVQGIQTMRAVCRSLRAVRGVQVARAYVGTTPPMTTHEIDTFDAELGPYRDFLLTASAVALRLELRNGPRGGTLDLGFGGVGPGRATGPVRPRGDGMLPAGLRGEERAWLDPTDGSVRLADLDHHASFREFFDHELGEVSQYVHDLGRSIGVELHIG